MTEPSNIAQSTTEPSNIAQSTTEPSNIAQSTTEPSNIAQSTDESTVRAGVRRASARSQERSRSGDSSPYAHRFRTATAVLVGFAIGAIVIAVAVAVASGGRTAAKSAPWSSWSPPDTGTAAALDIAGHVAPFYRISSVDQLSVVTVVELESAAAAAAQAAAAANGTAPPASTGLQVAVHPSAVSSTISLLGGNTVAYNLCGVGGKNCAIGVGTPSAARLLLLRREALELALYTFRYMHSVDNVVAILPPGHSTQTSFLTKTLPTSQTSNKPLNMAVLFARQELAPLLSVPLSATLPEQFPPTVGGMVSAPEAGLVAQATARGLFTERVQQAQDGSSLIVLDPLPPQ